MKKEQITYDYEKDSLYPMRKSRVIYCTIQMQSQFWIVHSTALAFYTWGREITFWAGPFPDRLPTEYQQNNNKVPTEYLQSTSSSGAQAGLASGAPSPPAPQTTTTQPPHPTRSPLPYPPSIIIWWKNGPTVAPWNHSLKGSQHDFFWGKKAPK